MVWFFTPSLQNTIFIVCSSHARILRRDRGSGPPPPHEKSQSIGFLSNNGPDSLKNDKATKPAFNVLVIIGTPAQRHLDE